jgi:hypothetical protein
MSSASEREILVLSGPNPPRNPKARRRTDHGWAPSGSNRRPTDYLAVVSMNDYRASKIAAHDAIHTDHDARVSQITVRATK